MLAVTGRKSIIDIDLAEFAKPARGPRGLVLGAEDLPDLAGQRMTGGLLGEEARAREQEEEHAQGRGSGATPGP